MIRKSLAPAAEAAANLPTDIPSAFCAGWDTGGWDNVKWLAFEIDDGVESTGPRFTFQLGEFTEGACASSSVAPNTRLFTLEQSSTYSPFSAQNQYFGSPVALPRDQWVALQVEIHYASGTDGYLRVWLGETFIGEITGLTTFIASVENPFQLRLSNGLTWNGCSYQANTRYIQIPIGTIQTPNTLDSGSRPFIHPDHKLSDF